MGLLFWSRVVSGRETTIMSGEVQCRIRGKRLSLPTVSNVRFVLSVLTEVGGISIYSSSFLPEKSERCDVKQLCRNELVEWAEQEELQSYSMN